jgi:hypothetical protein
MVAKTSQKPLIIERIFNSLFDPTSGTLRRRIVTNNDISEAIDWCNRNSGTTLSKNNPANFIKDIIRGANANKMWPGVLHERRITARQLTGEGNVFEFVEYAPDQNEPFPLRFGYHAAVPHHQMQTVSVPLATKALGRDDETYLIQIAVKLGIVETHFALYSPLDVIEAHHLQIGIKLRLCEVDSLYSAVYRAADGQVGQMVITAEAKKKGQRILEEQIVQQVRAAFAETPVDLVAPIAMASVAHGIYIAEFVAVPRSALREFNSLELATEVLYELVPPVKGI